MFIAASQRPEDIGLVLRSDPALLQYRFQEAAAKEFKLRMRLQELERQTARAWELHSLSSVGRIPWPPLHGPVRPPTLHRAMQIVLDDNDNFPMASRTIATEIARRGLYRRRDGLPATASDIAARVSAYPQLFVRDTSTVRLRRAAHPRRRG